MTTKTKSQKSVEYTTIVKPRFTTLINPKFPSLHSYEVYDEADKLFGTPHKYVEAIRYIIANGYRVDIRYHVDNRFWPEEDGEFKIEIVEKLNFPVRYPAPKGVDKAPVFRIMFRSGFFYDNAMRALYKDIQYGLVVLKAKRKPINEIVNLKLNQVKKTGRVTLADEAHISPNKKK